MTMLNPTLERGFPSAEVAARLKKKRQLQARTGYGRRPSQEMPRQLESPLNALINRREPMYLDEIPAQQLESPLYGYINQREPISLDWVEADQLEFPLVAQINGRERQPVSCLPPQEESPLNALINRHDEPRTWRLSRHILGRTHPRR